MEHSFIAWAKQRATKLPQIPLGIGDDAALLAPSPLGTVVTTDALCEGTHFVLAECGPRAVGRKLAGVNLSDLAAMAADPAALFLTLCLPKNPTPGTLASEIFEGVFEMAEQFQVAIAGGDTNVWNGPLVVSLTAVGVPMSTRCWTRSGAQVGDKIVVTGSLGGSILGKHLNFVPRLALTRRLIDTLRVHAATDISDGLGIDLLNVFTASGCGAVLELDKVPISDAAHQLAAQTGRSPLDHALADGEDFELLLAIPDSETSKLPVEIEGVPLTVVGEFTSRSGLWSRQQGKWQQLAPKGYVHR
jgi:thiamine-monophosphate kinase